MKKVLLAGGSGMIGQRLTTLLQKAGYEVSWLSRKKTLPQQVSSFCWNPEKHEIDPTAFEGTFAIVSLAGSHIADGRWTEARKKNIVQSRILAAETLIKGLQSVPNQVQRFVSASAIGYYGNRGDALLSENVIAGNGFLSSVCSAWEDAYKKSPVTPITFRIGIVLSKTMGALPEMAAPLKFGICPVPGNGNQYISWIHLDDLCRMLLFAIENENVNGVYNAVAPTPATSRDFMFTLRKIFAPNAVAVPVPGFMLQLILGEKTALILDSTRASASEIMKAGFTFTFPDLTNALKNIYER